MTKQRSGTFWTGRNGQESRIFSLGYAGQPPSRMFPIGPRVSRTELHRIYTGLSTQLTAAARAPGRAVIPHERAAELRTIFPYLRSWARKLGPSVVDGLRPPRALRRTKFGVPVDGIAPQLTVRFDIETLGAEADSVGQLLRYRKDWSRPSTQPWGFRTSHWPSGAAKRMSPSRRAADGHGRKLASGLTCRHSQRSALGVIRHCGDRPNDTPPLPTPSGKNRVAAILVRVEERRERAWRGTEPRVIGARITRLARLEIAAHRRLDDNSPPVTPYRDE
jgi:hypothetical protein